MPTCDAIFLVLQCVRPFGVVSSVLMIRASTLLVGDLSWCPHSRLVVEAVQSLCDKPLSPLADRLVRRPASASDIGAADPFSARQNQLRPEREVPIHPGSMRQPDEFLALAVG